MTTITEVKKKVQINGLLQKLPKIESASSDSLFKTIPRDILEETTEIVSNYISEKEFGTLAKIAFDRAIRYYERERYPARNLVNVKNIDSDFYQWLVGQGVTYALNAPGAQKRTTMFDISSRYARIFKAGAAIEITDELRNALTIDLMNELMQKVIDAKNELETSIIFKALSQAVPDGTTYTGIYWSDHVFDATGTAYTDATLTHDKITDMLYVLEDEGYTPTHMVMGRDIFYRLLDLEPFKDASQKWQNVSSPKAVSIIEGEIPGKPILPGMSLVTLAVSRFAPSGEVILYDKNQYIDFVVREPLNSEVAPHDGLKDISMVTFRNRFGIAAREPIAAVKMINVQGKDMTNKGI